MRHLHRISLVLATALSCLLGPTAAHASEFGSESLSRLIRSKSLRLRTAAMPTTRGGIMPTTP